MTHLERIFTKHQELGKDLFLSNDQLNTNEDFSEELRKAYEATASDEGVTFHLTVPRRRKAKAELKASKRRSITLDHSGAIHIPSGMSGATLKGKVKRVKVLSDRARNAIIKAIDSKSGGCTINPKGQMVNRKDGYMVSLHGSEDRVELNDYKAIGEAIWKVTRMLQDNMSENYVGIWISGGYAVLDYSVLIMSKDVALNFGKAQQQEAIYGWAEDACFDC